MIETARITLVIPAFNAATHLPRLFENLSKQSEHFDQIIVCDDASTDNTAELAQTLGARVIRHNKNAGCSAAKNTGLTQVETEWVHFHDADDLFGTEFIARSKRRIRLDPNGFDALLFDIEQRRAETNEVMSRTFLSRSQFLTDPERYLLRNTINNGGVYRCSKLQSIGGFNGGPEMLYNEDRHFHLQLASSGARFVLEDAIGYITMWFAGSMSQSNQLRCLRSAFAVTQQYKTQCPTKNRDQAGQMFWHLAAGLAAHNDFEFAEKSVALALECGELRPENSSKLFRLLSRFNSRRALIWREHLIRIFKPHLRSNLPR